MKKIIAILLLVGIFSSTPTHAHSGLEKSTPADGETVTDTVEEITLQFSTAIEESSTVTIANEDGNTVETTSVEFDQDILTASFVEPLPNGIYEVTWDIIGEDGHQIEDVYSFTVDGQNEESVEETDESTTDGETAASDSNNVESSTNDSSIMPMIIVILVVVVVGSTIYFLRRKKQ